jgi:hypothetical protein
LKREHALSLFALLGALSWLFRDVLFFGGVYFKRDIHLVWHPQVESFVRCVAAGSWPVWDASLAFGQPLLADPSAQVLYPLTWLNLLARPSTYYSLYAIVHFALAAAGMRALARRLDLSPTAASVAAAIFSLSGPYLSMLDLWHHFAGVSWMPWVVLALDRSVRGGRRDMGLLALALALQILAGSADIVAMTLLLGAAISVRRLLDPPRPAWAAARGALLRLAGGGLLGLGLSAALWMSALEIAARAARADLPASVRTYWSMHPAVALEFITPGLWSALPLAGPLRAAFFESREPFLASIYLGVPVLGLVIAALTASRHSLRRVLLGAFVLATLVAMGPHTPVYGAAVTVLPALQILRYPVKVLAVAALAWSLLAGIGVDTWREADPRGRRSVAGALGLVLLLAGAAASVAWAAPAALAGRILELPGGVSLESVLGPAVLRLAVTVGLAALVCALALAGGVVGLNPRRQAAALAALAILDLLVFHRSPNPVAPALLYQHRPEVVSALGRHEPAVRVYVYDYSIPGRIARYLGGRAAYAPARMPEGFSLDAAAALGMQMYLAPESAGRWGVSQAFNVDYRGLHAAPLSRLTGLLLSVEDTPLHLRLLQLGGVEHAISLHALPDLPLEREVAGLFEHPIRLQKVPEPLGRTYAVGAARHAKSDAEAARLLLEPDFDPRREVVLAESPEEKEPPPQPGFRGATHIVEARPDRLLIDAETSAAGFVVVLDGFDPGWRVLLNGRPAELLRANLAFRAVAVPGGRHRIEMVYRPRGLRVGLVVAGLSLALVAAVLRPGRFS